jgi:hypothetical protein
MKIFFTILAMMQLTLGYSQTFIHQRITFDGNDMNNIPFKNPSIISNAHNTFSVDLTDYLYDSIRELIEINRPNIADSHPWISSDGLRLYYADDYYSSRLVMAKRTTINSFFDAPELINIPSVWGVSYWLSSDELDLYFTDYYNIFYTYRDAIDMPFHDPWIVELDGYPSPEYIDAISLSQDQTEIFLQWYNAGVHKVIEY